jgi:class 3 adenylate cyclase
MAKLTGSQRAKLPDSDFAYIDSRGDRRIPINDESHVRNALSRFDQVKFESEEARERARTRLLNAAKHYGIVPVGFITGQIESARKRPAQELPTGRVTLLFTDIEGSTALLDRFGERYEQLLSEVNDIIAKAVAATGGREVEVRADEYFAVFEEPAPAITAAVAFQRDLVVHEWPDGAAVRVRAGIHTGDIALTSSGYIGLPLHEASRLCAAAHGGQILVSGPVIEGASELGVEFLELGPHHLRGLPAATDVLQVAAAGLPSEFPPLRNI